MSNLFVYSGLFGESTGGSKKLTFDIKFSFRRLQDATRMSACTLGLSFCPEESSIWVCSL